jgi:hypothetical protein
MRVTIRMRVFIFYYLLLLFSRFLMTDWTLFSVFIGASQWLCSHELQG